MLHDIVVDELERHLSGTASQAFHDHLDKCPGCRAEVAAMTEFSKLMQELKVAPEAAPQPSLGFYNRVANRIVEDQRREAWGLFSPGAAFFRRIAFASLLLLAGLGSFLVTRESSYIAPAPEAISQPANATVIMQHDLSDDHAPSADRDRMFVTLATYRE
jgi:predicted anti-sigma-YlaC factor YlaD